MKKVIFIVLAVAIASCSKENMVEPIENNDDTTPPVEVSKFTGDFKLEKIVIGDPQAGELIDEIEFDCPNTWIFQAEFNFRKYVYAFSEEDRECTYRYQTDNSYTTPEDNVIIVGDQTTYIVTVLGDYYILTETNASGNRETDHYLKRI